MSVQRVAGIVLMVVGVTLLIVGYNASESFSDQLSKTFTGKWTDNTAWYIYGGLGLGLFGLLVSFFAGRGESR